MDRNTEFPEVGKVSSDLFEHIILPRLGARDPSVLVGPQNGVDVGVVALPGDQVMALTTDPFFIVPAYGWERAAWFAVHILASDASTSGLPPRYMTIDLNLPMEMTGAQFTAMWEATHQACVDLNVAIVTGHTGRYHGCGYPMVGGATVISVGPRSQYVTPRDARPGDILVVTKGAAIEATGLFAATFPDRIARALGPELAREADRVFAQMSVVDDALTAVQVGVRDKGVTAMHDATECGVVGGVCEMAEASGVGVLLDLPRVLVPEPVAKVCAHFGIDPYLSISEGTLLIAVRPHKLAELLLRLGDRGIPATAAGEFLPRSEGRTVVHATGPAPLVHPRVDPFWNAFARASAEPA